MADKRVLYLIRHGVAAERGPEYPDDSRRPLTPAGRARLREIGAGLVALGVEIDEMLTSPFARTRESAEILAEAWKAPPRITNLRGLEVGGRRADVYAALTSRRADEDVALVGHMPGIGQLAAELIGASRDLDFRKGGVACIALDRTPSPGAGTLRWFAPPKLLRLIGRG